MRRNHTKSRLGCRSCKQRHVKCDEKHPSCTNCTLTKRRCSYLQPIGRTPEVLQTLSNTGNLTSLTSALPSPSATVRTTGSSGASPVAHIPSAICPIAASSAGAVPVANLLCPVSAATPADVISAVATPTDSILTSDQSSGTPRLPPSYSLSHLELLYHFEHGLINTACPGSVHGSTFYNIAIKQALKASYLMDQLLALSAAHKSTTMSEAADRLACRSEATWLQTKALASFNRLDTESLEADDMTNLIFSILLCQQAVFETLSYRGPLPTVLDKFVQCLRLFRGIRTIAVSSWKSFHAHLEAESGVSYHFQDLPQVNRSTPIAHFSKLIELTERGDLGPDHSIACRSAIICLQQLFDVQQNSASDLFQRSQMALEFLVRVPIEFMSVVQQRRPEALIILATYAVLIHQARNYWAFGDAGCFLIESIGFYLGAYWDMWLEWPRQMLL